MGFVQDIVTAPPAVMRTKRELSITAYPYKGTYFFKIREISDVLSIKQPFQFTANIRHSLGSKSVLKGDDTEAFRKESDYPSTPFISVTDIVQFLTMESSRAMYEKSLIYNRMLEEFKEYQAYAATHGNP